MAGAPAPPSSPSLLPLSEMSLSELLVQELLVHIPKSVLLIRDISVRIRIRIRIRPLFSSVADNMPTKNIFFFFKVLLLITFSRYIYIDKK